MEVSNSIIENLEWIEPSDKQSITFLLRSSIDKFPTEYIKDNYRKALEELSNKE
jgi:citrate lyase gamma subunit